jgi:deazaflavin-dependent oxidoreductase (nitroreductase family)
MNRIPRSLAGHDFCNLTTTGRKSGLPRTIEIWFAVDGEPETVYLLSGGRDQSDWVKNIIQNPRVSIELGDRTFAGVARIVNGGQEEDARARRLLAAKYQGWSEGKKLSGWARTSLPVAIDLEVRARHARPAFGAPPRRAPGRERPGSRPKT